MEEQGDLRSGGDRTEGSAGLRPLRPVAHVPAARFRAPWRQRAAYRGTQVACMGQGAAWGIPGERGCLCPERAPVKIRRPGPRGSMASPSSFQVPGATHPGSGSPQVNAFCGHQGQEAAAAFTDRGVGALGDPGCRVTVPCHVGSTDFREWKPRVQVCRVGAVWGSLSQRRTLSGLS